MKVALGGRSALAASVTPLRAGGEALDEQAFGPLVDFLTDSGLTGLLALGTTGEGIALSVAERIQAAEAFIEASSGRLRVFVHCGAQTTRDTVALAEHAASAGADAVAVIGPPYFQLDEDALVAHFAAAARACAPLPFYLYEFERTSGYAIPLPAIARLRELVPNLAGLKVSDTPFERFRPYLLDDLDVFVGPEALIFEGLENGAAGAVSGLAAAFPELVVEVVRSPTAEGATRLGALRATIERFPRHAALKRMLARRGVPVREDVRAPLRPLSSGERDELDALLEAALAPAGA
jgi:dihydrodipicolinate synthase/N-acetylneuraminate lyase